MHFGTLARTLAAAALFVAAPLALAGPVVEVRVDDGAIAVSRGTVSTRSDDDAVSFVLRSPGYVFAEQGVLVGTRGAALRCAAESDTRWRCEKTAHVAGARYAVQINLQPADPSRGRAPPGTSVWIVAD